MTVRLSSKIWDCDDGLLMHWCPGCKSRHYIDTQEPNGSGAIWRWDGNAEAPTFSPSVNIVGQCHYFITSGQIQFCGDSQHALAGQTVPFPDIPDWVRA